MREQEIFLFTKMS